MSLEPRFAESFAKGIPLEFSSGDRQVEIPRAAAAAKRLLDVIGAVALLFLVSPLLLIVAALIWLDSGGPVLFRQTRLGLGGRPFEVLKFRTMTVLENGDHVRQATLHDPRVTRVGRMLRKTSLDELPQLINVLMGEMSLVGPRPHARAHDLYYARCIAHYSARQRVKPGITGWAQVNGLRGETPTIECMRQRVEYDLWYVKNFRIALDLQILLRTPLELLRPRNAH